MANSHYENKEITRALNFDSLYTDTDLEKAFGKEAWTKFPEEPQGAIVELDYKASNEALTIATETMTKVIDYLREQELKHQGEDYQATLERRRLIESIEKTIEHCQCPLDFYNY